MRASQLDMNTTQSNKKHSNETLSDRKLHDAINMLVIKRSSTIE